MGDEASNQTGNAGTPAATLDAEQVRQTTGELLGKHSQAGKKRGPYKKRNRENVPLSASAQKETDSTVPAAPVVGSVDKELVQKCVASVIGAVDGIVVRRVNQRAIRIGCDEDLAKELWQNCAITKGELEVISECTGAIVEKYQILGRYAPEAMLFASLVIWSGRIVLVMRKLDAIEATLAKRKEKQGAPKSSPE